MTNGQELDLVKIMLDASIIVQLDLLLLVLASVASWAIIFKKSSYYRLLNLHNDEFINEFENVNSLKELYEKSSELEDSPYKNIFVGGYQAFSDMREAHGGDLVALNDHYAKFGMTNIERAMSAAKIKVEEGMGDSLTTLASIGSVTPFVGLFGTVWGIINSFSGLAQGGATIETVAPGIAEALVATAVGLVAAIPAVWYYNKFGSRKAKISEGMVSFGEKLVNEIERILAKKTLE